MLLKDNSSYLLKNHGHVFSKEPFNLVNRNSFKFSPLSQTQAIGVEAAKDGKGVRIIVQKKKALNKPKARFAETVVARKGTRRAVKTVEGLTAGGYRGDLGKYAMARVSAVLASQKKNKKTVKIHRKVNKA